MSEEPKAEGPMDEEPVDEESFDEEAYEDVDDGYDVESDDADEYADEDESAVAEREVPADLVTSSELTKLRVMRRRKPKKDGTVRNPRRLGKVKACVYHPTEKRCIGFLVKRPDLLLMFHRKDWFIALDSYEMEDGRIVVDHKVEHKGPEVCERLGLSWDECVMWTGMPICVASGDQVGYVSSVTFSRSTGEIYSVQAADGVASKLIVGVLDIPADLVVGFKRGIGTELATDEELDEAEDMTYYTGAILVDDEVWDLEPEGGWAEAAGQFTAKASKKAHEVGEKAKPVVHDAAVKTEHAFNEGAATTSRQFHAAKGMFSDFKDQYNKARAGDESDDLDALAESKDIPSENMFAAFREEFNRAKAGVYDDEDTAKTEKADAYESDEDDVYEDEYEMDDETSAQGAEASDSDDDADAGEVAEEGPDVEYEDEYEGEEEYEEDEEPEIVTREERKTAAAASAAGNMFAAFREEYRKARDEDDAPKETDEPEEADEPEDADEEYEVEDEGYEPEGEEYETEDAEYEDDETEYEDEDGEYEYEEDDAPASKGSGTATTKKQDDFDLGKRVSGMFSAFKEEYDKGKNE
jgi:uncharacterized protein YrrD